jgi:hypothetical protein
MLSQSLCDHLADCQAPMGSLNDTAASLAPSWLPLPLLSIEPSSWSTLTLSLVIWCLVELAFYVLVAMIIHPRVSGLSTPPRNPLSPRECLRRVTRVTTRIKDVYSFEKFLSGWFKGASITDIRRGNLEVSR